MSAFQQQAQQLEASGVAYQLGADHLAGREGEDQGLARVAREVQEDVAKVKAMTLLFDERIRKIERRFKDELGGEDAGSKRERAAKRGDAVSQSKRSRAATARD